MLRKLLLFALIMFLAGCKSNLFDSLDSLPADPLSQLQAAQRSLDTGDFITALDRANGVLQNPSASQSEKDNASLIKGEAILGMKGFRLSSIASHIVETIKGNETADQMFNILKNSVSGLTSKDFAEANESFDDLINSDGKASKNVSNDGLLAAGVSEALEAVLKVVETFDTNQDGRISAQEAQAKETDWSNVSSQVLGAVDNAVTLVVASFGNLSSDEQEIKDSIQKAQCQVKIAQKYCADSNPDLSGCTVPPTVTDCQSALAQIDG